MCLGDIVGHSAHPNDVIDLLRERKITTVRGNYDEWAVDLRESSGVDYVGPEAEAADTAALSWTRQQLTTESRDFLAGLPRDGRTGVTAGGIPTGRIRESLAEDKRAKRSTLSTLMFGSMLSSMGKQPKRFQPKKLLFVHGSPREVIEYLYPATGASVLQTIAAAADADVIIHGHTHQSYWRAVPSGTPSPPTKKQTRRSTKPRRPDSEAAEESDPKHREPAVDEVVFVGVGSVGRPRVAGLAEFAVMEFLNREIAVDFHTVQYDVDREVADIRRSGLPSEMGEILRRGTVPQTV